MDVHELEDAVATLRVAPGDDPREVFRRGRRRRQRRRSLIASGSVAGVVVAAVVAAGLLGDDGGGRLPEIADRPSEATDGVERAPLAGAVDAHWPIELTYLQDGRELRFRGSSWADWSIELRVGEDQWRVVKREHPSENFDPGTTLIPGPHLGPGWRSTAGLDDRVVVDLEQIPGGPELVARAGLTADDVEAYASPNVEGCDGPLEECTPEGEIGARGIAHLPTGFPLFAHEAGSDDYSRTWIEALAIRWGTSGTGPSPIDDPSNTDDVEEEAAPDEGRVGTLMDGTFTLGADYLSSAGGSPDEVAIAFATEVLGWTSATPIDRSGDVASSPPRQVRMSLREPDGREVRIWLELLDGSVDAYGIRQLEHRLDPALRMDEDRTLNWSPLPSDEVAGGIVLVRTPEDGTVRVELDAAAAQAGRASLEDHVAFREPFCHRIQTALVALHDSRDRVIALSGSVWDGTEVARCGTDTVEAVEVDGDLDCQSAARSSSFRTLGEAQGDGARDAETALRDDLLGGAYGDDLEFVMTDRSSASLLDQDGREVLVASATELDGTWYVLEVEGC